eukprot:COSAG02_NODE_16605_length_1071_cov_1.358025_1_plen_125_part_00
MRGGDALTPVMPPQTRAQAAALDTNLSRSLAASTIVNNLVDRFDAAADAGEPAGQPRAATRAMVAAPRPSPDGGAELPGAATTSPVTSTSRMLAAARGIPQDIPLEFWCEQYQQAFEAKLSYDS